MVVISNYYSIFVASNKNFIIMKKYLISYYLVDENSWNLRNYFTIDESDLKKTIRRIESRGYHLTLSNIFVKAYTSLDDDVFNLAYVIVEIPNL